MTDTTTGTWPRITVTYDEKGIALWIQSRPDGPTAPVVLTVDDAHTLLSALHAAIDDRDALRMQLDDIDDADPDDFRGA
jgi:hypothetical protein